MKKSTKIKLFVLMAAVLVSALILKNKYQVESSYGIFGFESGTLDGWSLKRLPNHTNAKVITETARHGSYAVSVSLDPGDRYKDGWKSELSDSFFAPFHKEIWYRISHYIPEGKFQSQKKNPCMIAQWHNAADLGLDPLLSHRYEDGTLSSIISYSENPKPSEFEYINKTFFTIKATPNAWHDFVYKAYWPHGEEGYIQAWYNGKFMGTYRGIIGYKNDYLGPYFKAGVYCIKNPVQRLTAYFDEYRRGNKMQDVLLPGEKLEEAK